MSFNTFHFLPVPFGHLTFLFYTAPKSQCHSICPTLYIRKPGNIKAQPMTEKTLLCGAIYFINTNKRVFY